MFVIRHFSTKKKRLEKKKVVVRVFKCWVLMVARVLFFEELFKGRWRLCCSFKRNVCSLQVRLEGGQLRSMYVAFKNCPQAEKTRFNIRFHKATTCNETALNSTHTFKYHKQEMNLLVSMKYKTCRSETTCFGKKSNVCKTAKLWKKKLSFAGPKSVLRQSKAFNVLHSICCKLFDSTSLSTFSVLYFVV